jgi:hypothetical protein
MGAAPEGPKSPDEFDACERASNLSRESIIQKHRESWYSRKLAKQEDFRRKGFTSSSRSPRNKEMRGSCLGCPLTGWGLLRLE